MRKILLTSLICSLAIISLTAQCDVDGVFIDAILLDPNSSGNNFDTDGDGTAETADEFIQICNSTSAAIDLSTYTIGDDEASTSSLSLSGTIPAGECVVIMPDYTGTPPANFIIIPSLQLSNSGEPITLANGSSSCTVAFGVSCGSTPNCTEWPEDTDGIVTAGGEANPSITPSDLGMAPLPVSFVSFEAIAFKTANQISWATATEINNEMFQVERSIDGRNFDIIGEVKGNGSTYEVSEYSFVDTKPSNGVNYYRLKQIDFDGAYDYSKIIYVNNSNENILIYPTKANNEINVQLKNENATATIVNKIGQTMFTTELITGENTIDISTLNSGHYFIRINTIGNTQTERFIKF